MKMARKRAFSLCFLINDRELIETQIVVIPLAVQWISALQPVNHLIYDNRSFALINVIGVWIKMDIKRNTRYVLYTLYSLLCQVWLLGINCVSPQQFSFSVDYFFRFPAVSIYRILQSEIIFLAYGVAVRSASSNRVSALTASDISSSNL